MRAIGMNCILWLTLVVALVNLAHGLWLRSPYLLAGAACAVGFVGVRRTVRPPRAAEPSEATAEFAELPQAASHREIDAGDTDALVEQMVDQGRCALLLRPQIADTLCLEHFSRALHAFNGAMALVPDGEVTLGDEQQRARAVKVGAFFLDRYPVTNRLYYEFVSGGGYEQVALWDAAIWPAVLDFVDRTGAPGPRYWRRGCYLPGEEDLPVVGVSYYEAAACARWFGKRLASDAEWVKAASWPIAVSPTARSQRRYPWGDSMDREKANVWGSGPGRIVPVGQFAEGVSVGGVYQLIGNVWEWTSGAFNVQRTDGDLTLPTPMKSLRGGAFDTYFDTQATCQFQSGESPLARRYNVGFRCAIGVCDLMLAHNAAAPPAAVVEPGCEVLS
jgi:iron(II)-dependent oxidoreductase